MGKPDRTRCLICDRSFIPSRSDAITCGGACRQKAYRIRRKIGDAALQLIVGSQVGSRPRRLVITRNARAGSRLAPPRGGWENAGIFGPGWAVTFRTSEAPRNPVTASLPDILETEEDWLRRHPGKTAQDFAEYERRYSLSPTAAAGILRRAELQRAKLPPVVEVALRKIAGQPVDVPTLEAALRQAEGFGGERVAFALDGYAHTSFNISPTLVTGRQGAVLVIEDPRRLAASLRAALERAAER